MPQIGQAPGPTCADLRMHRAGVDRALRHGLRRRRFRRREILRRVGGELGAAARRAEVVGSARHAAADAAWCAGSTVMPQTGSRTPPGSPRLASCAWRVMRSRPRRACPSAGCPRALERLTAPADAPIFAPRRKSPAERRLLGHDGVAFQERACNLYLGGYISKHAKGHQGLLRQAAQPDRGPGARHRAHGRRRPLLHRHRHADFGGARRAAAAGGGNPARSRGALRRARDRVGQQGRAAPEDRGADERASARAER